MEAHCILGTLLCLLNLHVSSSWSFHIEGPYTMCERKDEFVYRFDLPNLKDDNEKESTTRLKDVIEGKWTVITNVATFCGYTEQLDDMNAVQSLSEAEGVPFTIIGVGCNQFGHQLPQTNRTEIMNTVKYVRPGKGYGPNYPWYGVAEVNGENEIGLYTFLKDLCPPYQKDIGERAKLIYDPIRSGDVTWNFEKFLVCPKGRAIARFHPQVPVRSIYNHFVRNRFLDM